MKPIKLKLLIFIKIVILGFFFILFLICSKNIERILLIFITIIIYSLFQNETIRLNYINTIIVGLVIGLVLGNSVVFLYINNEEKNIEGESYYPNIKENTNSKTAVILISKGENENFNSKTILNNIYNNGSIKEKILAPIYVFSYKLAYEEMGSSKFNNICENLSRVLQNQLGYDYDVYVAYTNIHPNIKNQLEKFIDNYDKIILTPLFIYESDNYLKLMNYINNRIIYSETELNTTPFLWQSEKLPKQIALRVANNIPSKNRSMTGIILIGSEKNNNLKQEKEFINKIINNFKSYEFDSDKILISIEKNLSSTIKKNVHNLQEKGVNRIIVISFSSFMDDINRKRTINKIINDINDHVIIQYIDGWGVGENLTNELEYKVRIENLKD